MNENKSTLHFNTSVQHAGSRHRIGNGLIGATEGSVTFRTKEATEAPVYSRLGNTSNHFELQELLATLHCTDAAIATGSGMSALTLAMFALAKPGDHILCIDICYGGTYNFLTKVLKKWGVETTFAAVKDWAKVKRPNTKFAFIESITNPFCVPQDIAAAVEFSRKNQLISICDNTFAGPYLCKPAALGIDVVLESATKYLNGHSDVIAGVLCSSQNLIELMSSYHSYLGTFLPPPQCVQLMRGIRTLPIRMEVHCRNGLAFAKFMRSHSAVAEVFYGCAEGDQKNYQFRNGFGGMVAVKFKETVDVNKLMKGLRLITDVPSLGGTETTATRPAYTTNWFMSDLQKSTLGISPQLVRFSIGLENPEDLAADIENAINK